MTSSNMTPTLEDVARAAGVSTATVSRCLNTPDRVVDSTRERVLQAVETLGYTPNFGARAMAAKRTYTIGAIVPTLENAIFAKGLQAFQEELHQRGYTLLVSSSSYQPDIEEEQIRTLMARGADGLLLIGYDRDAEIHNHLQKRGFPVLLAWSHRDDAALPSVGFDNKAAMRAMTQAVIKHGHKRLAMISGISAGNDRAADRIAGFCAAAQEYGLDPAQLPIVETEYQVDAGAQAFAQIMSGANRPTAVICGNDVLAAGAVIRAQDMGLSVPGDVSITGFDNMDLALVVRPALATVRVPHRQMGRIAAYQLVKMVESQSAADPVRLDTELVLRESLGPAPK